MSPAWTVHTARLLLRPVGWDDLPDLTALKGDPQVFATMLGGVRSPVQVQAELADDVAFWAAHGVGMWAVREAGAFRGITGLHQRPDGRGFGLRFAFRADAGRRGLAREAAGAALRFAHDQAGLPVVVAVAREDNMRSRTVLGAVGMVQRREFLRDGHRMLVFESLRREPPPGV